MSRKINKYLNMPIYCQLGSILKELIKENVYKPDSLLPTEENLMAEYEVSRTTVREAIKILERDGLVRKIQGKGTFVLKPKIYEVLPHFTSFSQNMSQRGLQVRTEVLDVKEINADIHLAYQMNVAEGAGLLQIVRLRHVDEEPLVLTTSYLLRDISKEEDFTGSIHTILEKNYQIPIKEGEAVIEAIKASESESKLLRMKNGDPILKITWKTFMMNGLLVEISVNKYRSDRYHYFVKMIRENYDK